MNPLKHMEVLFGAAVAAALLMAATPHQPRVTSVGARTSLPLPQSTATTATVVVIEPMPVVIIKGKRMTGREKRRAALTESAVAAPVRS